MPRFVRPSRLHQTTGKGSRLIKPMPLVLVDRHQNWFFSVLASHGTGFIKTFFNKRCKYLEYAFEVNSDQKFNIVGYCQLKYPMSSAQLALLLPVRCHVFATDISEKLSTPFDKIDGKIRLGHQSITASVHLPVQLNPDYELLHTTVELTGAPAPVAPCWLKPPTNEQINPKNKVKLFL